MSREGVLLLVGMIVIAPIRSKEYDLASLLAGITPENLLVKPILVRPLAKSFCNGGSLRARSRTYCLAPIEHRQLNP